MIMDNLNAIQGKIYGCQRINDSSIYKTVVLPNNITVLDLSYFTQPNTKYIIKWNYDLKGQTINLPEGCILLFDGGSISNGTLVGDNTTIVSYLDNTEIFRNVELKGSFLYPNNLDILVEDVDTSGKTIKEIYKKLVITTGDSVDPEEVYIKCYELKDIERTVRFMDGDTEIESLRTTMYGNTFYSTDFPEYPEDESKSGVTFFGWALNTKNEPITEELLYTKGKKDCIIDTLDTEIRFYARWRYAVKFIYLEATSVNLEVSDTEYYKISSANIQLPILLSGDNRIPLWAKYTGTWLIKYNDGESHEDTYIHTGDALTSNLTLLCEWQWYHLLVFNFNYQGQSEEREILQNEDGTWDSFNLSTILMSPSFPDRSLESSPKGCTGWTALGRTYNIDDVFTPDIAGSTTFTARWENAEFYDIHYHYLYSNEWEFDENGNVTSGYSHVKTDLNRIKNTVRPLWYPTEDDLGNSVITDNLVFRFWSANLAPSAYNYVYNYSINTDKTPYSQYENGRYVAHLYLVVSPNVDILLLYNNETLYPNKVHYEGQASLQGTGLVSIFNLGYTGLDSIYNSEIFYNAHTNDGLLEKDFNGWKFISPTKYITGEHAGEDIEDSTVYGKHFDSDFITPYVVTNLLGTSLTFKALWEPRYRITLYPEPNSGLKYINQESFTGANADYINDIVNDIKNSGVTNPQFKDAEVNNYWRDNSSNGGYYRYVPRKRRFRNELVYTTVDTTDLAQFYYPNHIIEKWYPYSKNDNAITSFSISYWFNNGDNYLAFSKIDDSISGSSYIAKWISAPYKIIFSYNCDEGDVLSTWQNEVPDPVTEIPNTAKAIKNIPIIGNTISKGTYKNENKYKFAGWNSSPNMDMIHYLGDSNANASNSTGPRVVYTNASDAAQYNLAFDSSKNSKYVAMNIHGGYPLQNIYAVVAFNPTNNNFTGSDNNISNYQYQNEALTNWFYNTYDTDRNYSGEKTIESEANHYIPNSITLFAEWTYTISYYKLGLLLSLNEEYTVGYRKQSITLPNARDYDSNADGWILKVANDNTELGFFESGGTYTDNGDRGNIIAIAGNDMVTVTFNGNKSTRILCTLADGTPIDKLDVEELTVLVSLIKGSKLGSAFSGSTLPTATKEYTIKLYGQNGYMLSESETLGTITYTGVWTNSPMPSTTVQESTEYSRTWNVPSYSNVGLMALNPGLGGGTANLDIKIGYVVPGYTHNGWYTQPDGLGVLISSNSSISKSDILAYIQQHDSNHTFTVSTPIEIYAYLTVLPKRYRLYGSDTNYDFSTNGYYPLNHSGSSWILLPSDRNYFTISDSDDWDNFKDKLFQYIIFPYKAGKTNPSEYFEHIETLFSNTSFVDAGNWEYYYTSGLIYSNNENYRYIVFYWNASAIGDGNDTDKITIN